MSSTSHTFTVTVNGCSLEQAQQVMNERIGPDEDYGFFYRIHHQDGHRQDVPRTPSVEGIRLDAESVKAEAHDRLQADLDNELTQKQVDAIQNTDDGAINLIINNLVEDDFWSAYDDTRSRVISHLIGMNEI